MAMPINPPSTPSKAGESGRRVPSPKRVFFRLCKDGSVQSRTTSQSGTLPTIRAAMPEATRCSAQSTPP